jgi:glycogen debranching enzyme
MVVHRIPVLVGGCHDFHRASDEPPFTRTRRAGHDLFEAASQFSMRLPELYCGFARDSTQGPVPYPVACLPQAWASGSIFMLLQATLGIRIDGAAKEVHIQRPLLPQGIESLRLCELPVGDARIDIEFHRLGNEVGAVPSGHTGHGIKVLAHL